MNVERNYDWKAPLALVLAGLALFIALGGRDVFDFSPGPGNVVVHIEPQRVAPVPFHEMPQVFPVAPTMVPAVPPGGEYRFIDPGEFGAVAYDPASSRFWNGWRRWFGQMPPIVPVILALALVFFGWRLLSQNRNRPGPMFQAPAPPPYQNPGPSAPPPPGPPSYGDITQRQGDS